MFSRYLRPKTLSSFTHKSKGKYICFIFLLSSSGELRVENNEASLNWFIQKWAQRI